MSIANQIKRADAPADAPALVRYDRACRAIAEAVAVDEVKDIRNQAMAMAAAAKIAKNHKAEADMMALRFRAERQLGLLMEAQRSAVGTAPAGRPKIGFQENPISKPITLAEAGIDKNLADRARKYAAVSETEFNDRVEEYRHRVSEEGERAVASLLKAGAAAQERRENDFYPTFQTLITEIKRRWKPLAKVIWEPCEGDGRVAAALRAAGFDVITGDIASGQDFFAFTQPPKKGVSLCTNPPFEHAREFIDHAFAIGITEMCLVLPERFWASGIGREQFERHRPAVWINLDWRDDYLGKGGSPDRALAVAIWNSPCAPSCRFEVWTRQAQNSESDGDAFAEVTGKAQLADADGVEPPLSETDQQPTSSPEADTPGLVANGSGYLIRPKCLNRDNCAGQGHKLCYQCRKALGEVAA